MKRIYLISLGCAKNQVDSELLLGNLRKCTIVEEIEDADVIIINTCGFIQSAKEESLETIFGAAQVKQDAAALGRRIELIVTGCMTERYRTELTQELPEVDAIYGIGEYDALSSHLSESKLPWKSDSRLLLSPRHFAYLRIADGCNQQCGFCAIPGIRGKLRSRTIEQCTDEARRLATHGVQELNIISQDTTSYGWDLYGRDRNNNHLLKLLDSLEAIETLPWIRIIYNYPAYISDAYLRHIAASTRICKYLDVPIQHIADSVLRAMRRGVTQAQTRDLIERIRTIIPEAAIRTTLIVGYPGESEQDFLELADFVSQAQFERLGVFMYSDEDGTYAYSLAGKIPQREIQRRHDHIMHLQKEIAERKNRALIGTTQRVLVDSQENDYWLGRTQFDMPEVDNSVIIHADTEIEVGTFQNVRIENAFEYDIEGSISA
ncbi:MAG: 30S ribosomal protein S12 methylthiotransferase RimO [Chitinivibrionales bacterium]|nr:30S ribosomal protein S12 methylthiotransferase RimO [Chitinivibrionales bacterium]